MSKTIHCASYGRNFYKKQTAVYRPRRRRHFYLATVMGVAKQRGKGTGFDEKAGICL